MRYENKGSYDEELFTEKYKQLTKIAADKEQALNKKFGDIPEFKEFFNEYVMAVSLMYAEEIDMYYADGFNFGLRLGMEAYME